MKKALLLALALGALGCSDDESSGKGQARFSVWGEEYIEQGIPESEFADGWSAKFDSFSIVLGQVVVASGSSEGDHLHGTQLFNLVTPGPHDVGTTKELEAKTWDEVSYQVAPISADTTLHSSASEADRAAMEAAGASVIVRGSFSNGSVTKTFDWAFSPHVTFSSCVAEQDGKETPGFAVASGGVEEVELTIHGDHFFYDDLASGNAVLRANALAAADDQANADGVVTLDELSQVSLVSISEGTYGTGSASNVNDLGAFVTALVGTLGHFRGEGHCTATTN